MLRHAMVLTILIAAPASGQAPAAPASRSNVEFARRTWREVRGYLVQAAIAAPDSVFGFKPAPQVRSFAETLDHIAASERGYCQMALAERPSAGGAGTGAKTKSEVLAALQSAGETCERAYGQGEEAAALVAYGGGRSSRLQVLLENVMHDYEHYGNVVTYLRLNGIVPPSSQPMPR
jgi:uncharacterized damage-inducible protein DinB